MYLSEYVRVEHPAPTAAPSGLEEKLRVLSGSADARTTELAELQAKSQAEQARLAQELERQRQALVTESARAHSYYSSKEVQKTC